IVSSIISQRITITINPLEGDLMPKKAADQAMLTTNWAAQMYIAVFTSGRSVPSRQTRTRAMPIPATRMVHTTGMSPSRVANQGLTRVGYQVFTDILVKTEPDEPRA